MAPPELKRRGLQWHLCDGSCPSSITCERRTSRCLKIYHSCEIADRDRDSVTQPLKLACAGSHWQATWHSVSAQLSDILFCQALCPLRQEMAAAAGLLRLFGPGGRFRVVCAGNAAQPAFPELGGTGVCNF